MIDTVRAQKRCELDPFVLIQNGFHEHVDRSRGTENKVIEVVSYNLHLPGESPHYLAYLPPRWDESTDSAGEGHAENVEKGNKDPLGCLTVETSLPKVLRGENVTLLAPDEVRPCFDVVSERISEKVGDVGDFGEFDVRGRIDAVYSWRTKYVSDYQHALKEMNLGRHVSQSIDHDGTVYWRNKQRVIRSYDKFMESGLDIAKNQLRFEVQINHAKSELDRVLGLKSTKIRDVVTWDTAKSILEFYLNALGADLVIADSEKLMRHFLTTCKTTTRAQRLMGYLMMLHVYSRDELFSQGVKRSTFYRSRAEIRSLGLSEGRAKTGILPPLKLPAKYTGEPVNLD